MSGAAVTIQVHSRSAEETQRMAAVLARSLRPGDVVALEGELGSGKTCFVRGLAEGLDIDPARVSSPTFVIMHEYEGPRHTLVHVDAYRLGSTDDVESIGWHEMLDSRQAVVAVEWPSRIQSVLPADRISIAIEPVGRDERVIRCDASARLADRLSLLSASAASAPAARPLPCRSCGRMIDAALRTWPFCSDRCRMADLGSWFAGGYRMSRPMHSDDELEV